MRDEVQELFRRTSEATRRFFRGNYDTLQAYRRIFRENGQVSRSGRLVLQDLMRCAGFGQEMNHLVEDKQGRVDPYKAGMIEGRRQMLERITDALAMPRDQIAELKFKAYDDGRSAESEFDPFAR